MRRYFAVFRAHAAEPSLRPSFVALRSSGSATQSHLEAADESPFSSGCNRGPLRIVLVDDEELVFHEVNKIVERKAKRWKLCCFLNPSEALQHIPLDRPDVVLLDTDMPGINGIDCSRMLKAILPSHPVILLSPRVSYATVSAYRRLALMAT